MRMNEKASLQVLKITIITLIIIFTSSIAVRAFNSKLNNIKIVLSNNYEMNIVTTKTKVQDILNENHIIYSTVNQFKKWTNKEPKLSKYSKSKKFTK